ncbi:MAG: adenylate/guanylate cyclase domain-containing protein [Burkholderiales bacterium]
MSQSTASVDRPLAVDKTSSSAKPELSSDEKLSKELLIFAAGLMTFATIFWLAIYWWMGIHLSSTLPLICQLLSAASIAVYWKTGNLAFLRVFQLSLFLFVPFVMQWAIGDFVSSSGVMLWAVLAPIGALIFHGDRESLPWIFAYLLFTAISGGLDYYLLADRHLKLPLQIVAVFFVLNFAAISTIIYYLVRHFIREKAASQSALQMEQARSEKLLLNILPAPIAERLKREERTIADGYADVTVLFADIVNFTQLSEEVSPNQIVALLNQVFSAFDNLAEKHGLEKIKTIGDAYMVAGGLAPKTERDYVAETAGMAKEMHAAMSQFAPVGHQPLALRIGIATGPAVAGVIGSKKFIYDLWGDTVNIASRVQSEAVARTTLVDTTTYKRLYTRYRFAEPRRVALKGKGELSVYELQS